MTNIMFSSFLLKNVLTNNLLLTTNLYNKLKRSKVVTSLGLPLVFTQIMLSPETVFFKY